MRHRANVVGLLVLAVLAVASSARAVDVCKVKVGKRDGVVQVFARGVIGNAALGRQRGHARHNAFANSRHLRRR